MSSVRLSFGVLGVTVLMIGAAAAQGIEDVRAAVRNQAPRYTASPEFVERLRASARPVTTSAWSSPRPG